MKKLPILFIGCLICFIARAESYRIACKHNADIGLNQNNTLAIVPSTLYTNLLAWFTFSYGDDPDVNYADYDYSLSLQSNTVYGSGIIEFNGDGEARTQSDLMDAEGYYIRAQFDSVLGNRYLVARAYNNFSWHLYSYRLECYIDSVAKYSDQTLSTGTWYDLIYNRNAHFFIDASQCTYESGWSLSGNVNAFGGNDGNRYLDGRIDTIIVSDRAFTTNEIVFFSRQ